MREINKRDKERNIKKMNDWGDVEYLGETINAAVLLLWMEWSTLGEELGAIQLVGIHWLLRQRVKSECGSIQ